MTEEKILKPTISSRQEHSYEDRKRRGKLPEIRLPRSLAEFNSLRHLFYDSGLVIDFYDFFKTKPNHNSKK